MGSLADLVHAGKAWRDGQVEEQRAGPGSLGGFGPEFAFAFGSGVGFSGQQLGV